MTSAYTGLGVELMVTGENSGTWGDKTNANLNILEQISGGYIEQAVNGTGATTLAVVDGNTGAALATRNIKLTGTITGNITVTIPLDVENFYFIENATSGAYTVEFKYVTGSGSSVTWSATDKGTKIILAKGNNAVNPDIVETIVGGLPGGSNTQIQFNNSGAFGASTNLTFDGTNVVLDAEGALRLGDATGSAYVGLKAPATITSDTAYTLTLPVATGAADQVLTTNGSGVLSFGDISGGIAWQSSIVTAATLSAVSGNGYWLDTTSNAITVTLPGSPAVGDNIIFTDYARKWATNAVTFNLNSLKFQGNTTPVPVYDTEGESVNIVYSGATQGWIPNTDGAVVNETSQAYTADFLVIGGGGGSAMVYGGGGGAGGYRNSFGSETSGRGSSSETALQFTPGVTYTVTVGGGGVGAQNYGGSAPGNAGINGQDSVISGSGITTITSLGGGGGEQNTINGKTGGCGGGAGSAANAGPGTAAQGFDGGQGGSGPGGPSGYSGGGGGGAGAAGLSSGATATTGVAGGAGLSSSITGSAVLRGGGGGGGSPGSGPAGPWYY